MNSALITINDVNYGNRLQNYATFKFLTKLSIFPQNIHITDIRKNSMLKRTKDKKKRFIKRIIPASFLRWGLEKKNYCLEDTLDFEKERIFNSFTDLFIEGCSLTLQHNSDLNMYFRKNVYNYYLVGSDQVWNPDFAGDDYYFLHFAEPDKRIAFAASIGYKTLSDAKLKEYSEYWKKMRYISVREDSAADLIEKAIGKRPDVFLDPTMLLSRQEWDDIAVKPSVKLPERYVVCLFLGNVPDSIMEKYSLPKDIKLVILNDKTYPDYFLFGPSEFLYVIKNAEFVFTDSFHCAVFSIIFHRPFYVFKRDQKSLGDMFSRFETLLGRMDMIDRIWSDKDGDLDARTYANFFEGGGITEERFLNSDRIMKEERERVTKIMKKILNI